MATAVAGSLAPDLPADVLLDVKDLSVAYRRDGKEVRLIEGVSFQLGRGEALGLAGESGCGKTTTALAVLGLLPTNLYRARGRSSSTRPTGSSRSTSAPSAACSRCGGRGSRWCSRAR